MAAITIGAGVIKTGYLITAYRTVDGSIGDPYRFIIFIIGTLKISDGITLYRSAIYPLHKYP